jgi:hypothetical protein
METMSYRGIARRPSWALDAVGCRLSNEELRRLEGGIEPSTLNEVRGTLVSSGQVAANPTYSSC